MSGEKEDIPHLEIGYEAFKDAEIIGSEFRSPEHRAAYRRANPRDENGRTAADRREDAFRQTGREG